MGCAEGSCTPTERFRVKRSLPIVIVLALVGLLLFPVFSSAGGAPSGAQLAARRVIASKVVTDPSAVREYWTSARMKAATPMEVELPGAPDPSDEAPRPDGPAAEFAPTGPSSDAVINRELRRVGGAGGAIPFVRDEIVNTSTAPFRTHGKVFFSSGGDDFVCSGTVITSPNENVVLTAGHCVYDNEGGGFSTNFIFVPGYRNGSEPFGAWTGQQLFTLAGWKAGDFDFDIGMARISPKSGDEIQEVVGSRGIGFNQSPNGHTFEAIGHPQAPPFKGERMYRCTSGFGYRDSGGAQPPIAIGCDMTGGSSGGGWVISGTTINSLTSYGYDELPGVLFGPFLGAAAQTLYETVGGGPAPTPTGSPSGTPTATPTVTPSPTPTEWGRSRDVPESRPEEAPDSEGQDDGRRRLPGVHARRADRDLSIHRPEHGRVRRRGQDEVHGQVQGPDPGPEGALFRLRSRGPSG